MATPSSVDEIVAAIQGMGEHDREELILRLAQLDDLIEDLEDVLDAIRAAQEEDTPYEEFVSELRAEGRDV